MHLLECFHPWFSLPILLFVIILFLDWFIFIQLLTGISQQHSWQDWSYSTMQRDSVGTSCNLHHPAVLLTCLNSLSHFVPLFIRKNIPVIRMDYWQSLLGQGGWMSGKFFFFVRMFMDWDRVEVHKVINTQKTNWSPAILTEQAWSIMDLLSEKLCSCGTKQVILRVGTIVPYMYYLFS